MAVTTAEQPFLCPREVNHFRRSWVDHERCTAIMVGSTMLLSVKMPHSGRVEEDHVEAFEMVSTTLIEGRNADAVDFFIGGDINIELKLGNAGKDLQDLDSIEWYGMYGPECKGGGEGPAARRKGANSIEELARGSREKSQLRARAGLAEECTAETLVVAERLGPICN